MQWSIIEMVKALLPTRSEGKELELDRRTANRGFYTLDLLRATLFDPVTVEAAQAIASAIQARAKAD